MTDSIKIDISRDKLTATIRISGAELPQREEILEALKRSGVAYGIQDNVVDFCSMVVPNDNMVIAKGDPPVPGKNGWI
ncbi:MAG: flagellar assembly protein A, partial [Desulfocucumaceae bacterium]